MPGELSNAYIVDFSKYARNMPQDAWARMPGQFHATGKNRVLRQFLDVFIRQCQELYDVLIDLQRMRTAYEATGEALDALGRIVGWRRGDPVLPDITEWFAPDIEATAPDKAEALVWVAGAGGKRTYTAGDPVYAYYIIAKAVRNHMRYGSVPEIVSFVKQLTNYDIRIDKSGPGEIVITVSGVSHVPLNLRETLINVVADDTVEMRYLIGIPAGCKVKAVLPY